MKSLGVCVKMCYSTNNFVVCDFPYILVQFFHNDNDKLWYFWHSSTYKQH